MSVKVMGWVWEIEDLSMTEKLILLGYADHAHNDGSHVFPGLERMGKRTGCSRRTIQRATQSLIEKGLLIKDGQRDSGTKQYRIPVPNYEQGVRESPPLVIEVTESQEGVSENTETGDRESPDPLLTIIKPDIENIRKNGGVVGYLTELFDQPVESDSRLVKWIKTQELVHGGDESYCNMIYGVKSRNPEMSVRVLISRIAELGGYA
jgi:hypothetical protein